MNCWKILYFYGCFWGGICCSLQAVLPPSGCQAIHIIVDGQEIDTSDAEDIDDDDDCCYFYYDECDEDVDVDEDWENFDDSWPGKREDSWFDGLTR